MATGAVNSEIGLPGGASSLPNSDWDPWYSKLKQMASAGAKSMMAGISAKAGSTTRGGRRWRRPDDQQLGRTRRGTSTPSRGASGSGTRTAWLHFEQRMLRPALRWSVSKRLEQAGHAKRIMGKCSFGATEPTAPQPRIMAVPNRECNENLPTSREHASSGAGSPL
jgi:hypothetical protein